MIFINASFTKCDASFETPYEADNRDAIFVATRYRTTDTKIMLHVKIGLDER